MPPRGRYAAGLAAPVGERGRAVLVELSVHARPVLVGLARSPAGPPAELAPIFRHGIAPGEAADDAVPDHRRSAGLTVLASGGPPPSTTGFTADGTRLGLPSKSLVTGRPHGRGRPAEQHSRHASGLLR